MIPLVVASERGFLAKPIVCDTWQGLHGRGCGMHAYYICQCGAWRVVLAEVVWNGLPEWVRVPYVKALCVVLCVFPSSSGLVESAVNLPGPPGKPEYSV